MIQKLLLGLCLIFINYLTVYPNINSIDQIDNNLLKIKEQSYEWSYSFFEDLKSQEGVKERLDNHIHGLQALYNKLTNQRDPSVKSLPMIMQGSLKMEEVVVALLRFNEHIFNTVKEVRQQYLPNNAISPENQKAAAAYQFFAHQVNAFSKMKEVEKLIKLLQAERLDIDKKLKIKLMDPLKNFYEKCITTLEGLNLNVVRFLKELNSVVKAMGQEKMQSSSQQSVIVQKDSNSFAEQWPKKLIDLEGRIVKDTKELLPQFKKIKEAALACVQYSNNKDKYSTVDNLKDADIGSKIAQQKRSLLEKMLKDLQAMQKTKFEKKFFLSKKKAIGKELDEFLVEVATQIAMLF